MGGSFADGAGLGELGRVGGSGAVVMEYVKRVLILI